MYRNLLLVTSFILAAIACNKPKTASSSKAIFGINEGDCRIWDGTEDLGHCRVLLRNTDLVNYYKNWSGTTNFHTLNWWVYRVRDIIKSKTEVELSDVHIDPSALINLGFDSHTILDEFNPILTSQELTCHNKIDKISDMMSPYLFQNKEIINDFLSSYIESLDSVDPMVAIALPLSNALFSKPNQESFNSQLKAFLNTAKALKLDVQGCKVIAEVGDDANYKKVENTVKLFKKILKTFDFSDVFEKNMRSWARNQPAVDCRFSGDNGTHAYCQILRSEDYDLVFKLRRVSGLYSSKTESVFSNVQDKTRIYSDW